MDKADLPAHCSAHGLQKAAVHRLAEAGCAANQIAALTGALSLARSRALYGGPSQMTLAGAAIAKVVGINRKQKLANRKDWFARKVGK